MRHEPPRLARLLVRLAAQRRLSIGPNRPAVASDRAKARLSHSA